MPSATCPDAALYHLGNEARVLFNEVLLTGTTALPTPFTITLAAIVNIGATTMTVTALPKAVYRGDRLRFANGSVVQVDADAAAAATSITILPAITSIPNANTCTHYPMVVFESAMSAKISVSGSNTEIRNIGACDWSSFLMTKRSATISLDGYPLDGDLGYPLIRAASLSRTSRLFVQVIEPDGRLFQASCWVQSFNSDSSQDNPFKRDYSLQVSGQPVYGTTTDVVLA